MLWHFDIFIKGAKDYANFRCIVDPIQKNYLIYRSKNIVLIFSEAEMVWPTFFADLF